MITFDPNTMTEPKYSRNLNQWLRREIHEGRPLKTLSLVSTWSGSCLYLGQWFDGEFIGTGLNQILTKGSRAQKFSLVNRDTKRESKHKFWTEYERLGICYFDPNHNCYGMAHFKRWTTTSPCRRTCNNCGHKQKLVRKKFVMMSEEWRSR